MTPVYKKPSHVDNARENEHYSHVFDSKSPGLLIATFFGDDHINNSEHFCKLFHGYDKEGNST